MTLLKITMIVACFLIFDAHTQLTKKKQDYLVINHNLICNCFCPAVRIDLSGIFYWYSNELMSLYLSLFRKQKTRVGILCWPLLGEVYGAHIHVSSLGETCWKPVNTLFKLKYLWLHCVVVGNLQKDDRDHQTASYNVGFISGPRHSTGSLTS